MIGVEISTLRLGIICEPEPLAQMVSSWLGDYLDDGTPEFVVRIKWLEPEAGKENNQDTFYNAESGFVEGCFILKSPSYFGVIDSKNRYAELEFTSTNPVLDIGLFLRSVVSIGLYGKGGFLLHSAGIVRNESTYIFFGKSGSGKSTVSRLSAGVKLLSDDFIGVFPSNDGVIAYSTPFWNPGWVRHTKNQAKVAGLYRLVQSQQVYLEPLRHSLAVSEILSCIPTVVAVDAYCAELISTIQMLLSQVNVYYLHFRKESTFWDVVALGENNS